MRTRESIEAQASSANKPSDKPKTGRERSLANLVAPWTSETAPKSPGRPKDDVAQIIARKVFEQNPELIYKAFSKALAKGGAFAFQVLSDRAYGKLKESKEITHSYQETPDADLIARITQLERDLGLAREIDEAGRIGIAQAGAPAPAEPKEDSHVLPGNGAVKTGPLS